MFSSKSLVALVCVGESWYQIKLHFHESSAETRSGTCVSFFVVPQCRTVGLGNSLLIAFNMGNILQRNAPTDGAFATPKIPTLSPEEVQIIKSSWKIPSANVSEEVCIYEHSNVTGRCLLLFINHRHSIRPSSFSTLFSSAFRKTSRSLDPSRMSRWRNWK